MNDKVPHDLIPLGKIIKPHGIKGELKIKLFNSDSKTFIIGQEVWINDGKNNFNLYVVENSSFLSKKFKLKLVSIDSRNSAELLRNHTLLVSRASFPKLKPEEFYLVDLIGFIVEDQNSNIVGKICEIMENPANDILVVVNNREENLIPLVDDFVKLFDFKNKKVIINVIDGLIGN